MAAIVLNDIAIYIRLFPQQVPLLAARFQALGTGS